MPSAPVDPPTPSKAPTIVETTSAKPMKALLRRKYLPPHLRKIMRPRPDSASPDHP